MWLYISSENKPTMHGYGYRKLIQNNDISIFDLIFYYAALHSWLELGKDSKMCSSWNERNTKDR